MHKKQIICGIIGMLVMIIPLTAFTPGLTRPVIILAAEEPQIDSQAAVLMDMDSEEILYEKNGQELYYPASIVKLLTALVVAEQCSMDGSVIFSYDAVYGVESDSGNSLQLEAGDKLTVKDCLYAMLLASSNQAANALAEYAAGSIEEFAGLMNEKAAALGCSASRFVNPSGLNEEGQKVTAEEMARIAGAALANSAVEEIASADHYTLPATLNNPKGCIIEIEHQLVNDAKTQYSYEAAYAGKTGYTAAAGNTLVTAAEKNGRKLLAVILQSEMTHYEDTIKLFDYGFQKQADSVEAPESVFAASDMSDEKSSSADGQDSDVSNHTGDRSKNWFLFPAACAAVFILFWFARLSVKRKRKRARYLVNKRGRTMKKQYRRERGKQ